VLNIGKENFSCNLYINNYVLPNVTSARDLGISITSNLSPTMQLHINDIVSRAHKRALMIHRCFTSRDVNTLLHAYIVYVRPLVEHNSVIWSPITLHDIDAIESVQRRFTKRLPGLQSVSHADRLQRLHLQSLELRRLITDLTWCYKIVFGYVDVDIGDSISFSPAVHTRGHGYKLFKKQSAGIRCSFLSERVINAWNDLLYLQTLILEP